MIFSAEMTALQARSAIRVFPGILVIQIVVAVVLGPLLGGERWSSEPLVLVALVASLAVVVAGTALLASARMVGTAVDTDSDPQNGATRENRGAISDQELAGRGLIADRLQDEVEWLRECARWLAQLDLGIFVGTADDPEAAGRSTAAGHDLDSTQEVESFLERLVR